jgi:hypothetical protein
MNRQILQFKVLKIQWNVCFWLIPNSHFSINVTYFVIVFKIDASISKIELTLHICGYLLFIFKIDASMSKMQLIFLIYHNLYL